MQTVPANKGDNETDKQKPERSEIGSTTTKVEQKVDEESAQPKRVKVASQSEWEAVFDLKSNRYYYWNKVEPVQSELWEGYESDGMGVSGRCCSAEGAVFRKGVCSLPGLWRMGRRIGGVIGVLWFL